MAVNAEKLREIQTALAHEFTNPTTSPCTPQRVHFVYAHVASVVDAHNLLPLAYPDFASRVTTWTFPTATRYEACGIIKQNAPYRDFIRARFLWKERADVKLTELPSNADTPTATAADGGTLIMIHDNSPTLGAATDPKVNVKVELPAQEAVPAGYPTIRRVCLSVPGQVGHHGEVNTPEAPGTNAVTLEYPERAQVQWTSFRITYGMRRIQNPSNEQALSGFLVSLGSNMPAADRLEHAQRGIAAGQALGIQYPALNAPFSDVGTQAEWRDWPTRCDNAGKETETTPARGAQGQAPHPPRQAQRPAGPPGQAPRPPGPPGQAPQPPGPPQRPGQPQPRPRP